MVTILVAVYNAEKYLGRCVDSILNQEFEDFELILVNDGSKDSSKEIIDGYAKADSRVKPVHKENSGVSDTRNLAMSLAKGEYIQFLDADDWITPEATKLLYRTATEKQADLVIADFYRVVGERIAPKGDIDTDEVMDVQTFGDHLMQNPADFYYGVVWNKLYKTSIIRENDIKMDKDVNFCEDFIFNLEYLLKCERIAALQVPIYYYVKTEGSLVSKSLNLKKIADTKFNVIKYYDNFFKNIHSTEEYNDRKLRILGYLVDYAKDDPASALSTNTKKLGEESVPVYFIKGIEENIVSYNYYENKLIQRYLHAVAHKTELRDNEVSVLMVLRLAKNGADIKQISSMLQYGIPQTFLILQGLMIKKLVEKEKQEKPEGKEVREEPVYYLADEAQKLIGELDNVLLDFEEIRYRGFTPEEIESSKNYEKRTLENLKRVLQDPNSAEK